VAVHDPGDGVAAPFDGKQVKVLVEAATLIGVAAEQGIPTRVTRAVQGSADHVGNLATVFHDVDLPAAGPADRFEIRPQHPEGRPDTLADGQLDPGFEAPVRMGELALGLDAAGRVG
jgi:hypothetical protein